MIKYLAVKLFGTDFMNYNLQNLQILYKMRMRCLHEVYFQPKMFETIGFHHQGSYNISAQIYSLNEKDKNYAYPFLNRKRFLQQLYDQCENDKVDTQKFEYQSKKFDISFNEQQFFFNGGCRFKLEVDVSSQQQIQRSLFLELKLVKYNKNSLRNSLSKDGKAMQSTQNMIKTTLQDDKDISNDKINTQNKKQQKNKHEKPVQVVCSIIVQINTSSQCDAQPLSMYQTILFPEQAYFGKLFYLVNHIRLGYKFRNSSHTLSSFVSSRSSFQSNTRQSTRLKRQSFTIKPQQYHQPFSIMQGVFSSSLSIFQFMIKQQIIEINRATKLQMQLLNEPNRSVSYIQKHSRYTSDLSKLSSSKINPNSSILSKSKKKNQPFFLSVPDKNCFLDNTDLLNYYQCETQEQLLSILFQQSVNLNILICSKWQNILSIISRLKWNASYFHKTLNNLRFQIQSLAKTKVKNSLIINNDGIGIQNCHNLKYKFYIHQFLPFFYTKKSINRCLSYEPNMSSQHILFILVHGFNGNELDMSRVKSFIAYFCTPHFLVLKKITSDILQPIQTIGKIAAQQIKQYLKTRPFIKRINFVGFSLGGVIIRASLQYLKLYHSMFNMLMTLSSPHLGVKQIKSCIVKTGMHILHKIRGAKNIKQLLLGQQNKNTVSEDKGLQQISQQVSYLQKLANDDSMKAFNNVIVCGSFEDKYVPAFSAVLQYNGQNVKIRNMQLNLQKNIRNLHQIIVKFSEKKKVSAWDRITGRRVHINFLDDDSFLYFLLAQYFHIF